MGTAALLRRLIMDRRGVRDDELSSIGLKRQTGANVGAAHRLDWLAHGRRSQDRRQALHHHHFRLSDFGRLGRGGHATPARSAR